MNIKPRISNYLFIFLLVTSFSTFAQDETSTQGLRFGVRVGPTVSIFSSSQPHTSEALGFTAGAVVEYGLSENFSVQTEPAFLQQGGQYIRFSDGTRFGDDGILSIYTTSSKVAANYIDLPLMAKYNFSSIGNFRPNVILGGAFGYRINANETYTRTYHYNQTFFTANGREDVSSEFEKFQIGATAGLGGEVSLGSKRLLIDFRYRYGITPAKKSFSYIDLNAVQDDLRTNSFYFTIGLGF
jgi:opacity protein-like surface antigen